MFFLLRMLTFSIVFAISTAAGTQQPEENATQNVIRESVEVRFVNVTLTAMGKNGDYIRDLKPEQITITEDGASQRIADFTLYSFGHGVPRSVGFLFDNSWSMDEANQGVKKLEIAKAALTRVAKSLSPDDSLVLLRTNFPAGKEPAIIEDRELQTETMEALRIRGGGTMLLDRLSLLVKELANKPGRRLLVICSDGVDNGSKAKLEELLERIHDADLTVTCIITSEFQKAKSWGTFAQREAEKGKKLLETLASDTGGSALYPTKPDDVSAVPAKLEAFLTSQYFISYQSSNPAGFGWRTIEIQTHRKDVKKLIYRKGYFAGEEG